METATETLTRDQFAWLSGRAAGLAGTARKRSSQEELQEIGRYMQQLLAEIARLRPDLTAAHTEV